MVWTCPLGLEWPRLLGAAPPIPASLAISAAGGLWTGDAAQPTATLLPGQTPNMAGANAVAADENGFVFYATLQLAQVPVPNPSEIFRVIVSGGAGVLPEQARLS